MFTQDFQISAHVFIIVKYQFFFPPWRNSLLIVELHDHTPTHHTLGLLWTCDQLVADAST